MKLIQDIRLRLVKYKILILYFFLNLCLYGAFSVKHFAPDTYFTEALGWEMTVSQYFQNGRWLMSAFSYFCDVFQITYTDAQSLSWWVAIISISISSFVIYRLLIKRFSPVSSLIQEVWFIVIAFMMISNVFLLEYFIFPEYTGMMCLGLFFDVLAAKSVLKALDTKQIKYYVLGVILAIVGINGHQGNFATLILLCVVLTPNIFESVRVFFVKNVAIGSAYLIPALLNAYQVHLGGGGRVAGEGIQLGESFVKSTEGLKVLLQTTANFMPYGFYFLICIVLGIWLLWNVVKNKSWVALFHAFYCFVIACLGIYAPLMVTDVHYIDVVPRTVFIMGSVVPVLLICIRRSNTNYQRDFVVPIVILIFLVVQYAGIQKITTSHFQVNAVDRYEAQYIGDFLREHEETTGVQVTKMALYWDGNVCGLAPNTIGYGAVNERVMSNDWAAPLAIVCLDGYQIEMTEKSDKVYDTYFKGKDWRQINDEQFVVIDDTLHFCAY